MPGNRLFSRSRSVSTSASQHYAVRMCLLGEPGAGKSTLFHRIKHRTFRDNSEDASNSLGINTGLASRNRSYDCHTVVLRPKNRRKKINLTVVDTASRERYQSLTSQYYRGAHVILLVCSLDSEYTLTRLAKWHQEAQYYVNETEVIYAIAATKSDLSNDEKEVSEETLIRFSEHYEIGRMFVFEVSSKTGAGVDTMLGYLAETVVERFEKESASFNIKNPSTDERSGLLDHAGGDKESPLSSLTTNDSNVIEIQHKRTSKCCGNCVIL